jgi:hypothetical protein
MSWHDGAAGTHSLKNLLSPYVRETGVEVLDARSEVLKLVLVAALDLVGLANDEVQGQLDAAVVLLGREPGGAAGARGRGEADLVVAGFGCREGEAAGGGAALGHDAVVVVEDFLQVQSVSPVVH